jgi:protein-tyrosine phosphatase
MIPPRIRRVLRAIKHLPDRLLHPHRRATATERLRRQGVPDRILVLCQGNICRSPYAEAVLQRRLGDLGLSTVGVSSAGFLEAGRETPVEALSVSQARGYDLTRHRSRRVTDAAVRGSGVVLVMDRRQRRRALNMGARPEGVFLLGDFDPEPIETRTIPDPIDRPLEFVAGVYERIERCVEVVALTTAASRSLSP